MTAPPSDERLRWIEEVFTDPGSMATYPALVRELLDEVKRLRPIAEAAAELARLERQMRRDGFVSGVDIRQAREDVWRAYEAAS